MSFRRGFQGWRCSPIIYGLFFLGAGAGCTPSPSAHSEPANAQAKNENSSAAGTFFLSPDKQEAAGIQLGTVTEMVLQARATVPGRVQYDDYRHLEIKTPASGILLEPRVKPGDVVQEGDVLALLSLPEVGTARADVLRRKVEFDLALQKFEWKDAACIGLKQLVEAVNAGRDPQSLSTDLGDLKLGNYRAAVVSAYSRFRLAQSLAAAVDPANNSGALPGRTIQERLSERDTARASLAAIIEQSLFQATQDRDMSKLELSDADRRLKISEQVVKTLLGDSRSEPAEINEDQLSLVEIRAPIAGTIESRTFSRRERINQGDPLFVLANTSQLWVAADIREMEWRALSLKPGENLQLTSPAFPGKELTSKVEYVGRVVDPLSNAVPLVAAVPNPDGLLRPGQFVWVQLPLGKAHSGLAIPESAIVEHEGQPFVFIALPDNQFQRVDIQPGIHQSEFVEVLSGLDSGMEVVVSGAFALKSELLLEREE